MSTLTATTICALIRKKHAKDVFVAECKSGSTWFGKHCRLDAWAMKKSWANPAFYGYEIKVSRNDFLRDDKWRRYLELCSDFYFVSPPDIIQKDEIPKEAGLIWCSKNGARLYTKKKAPSRQIAPPEDLLLYVIMQYGPTGAKASDDRGSWEKRHWEKWTKEKKIDRDFGYCVSKAIGKRVEEEIVKVQIEQGRILKEVESLKTVKEFAEAHGLDLYSSWGLGRRLKELPWLLKAMKEVQSDGFKELATKHKNALENLLSLPSLSTQKERL